MDFQFAPWEQLTDEVTDGDVDKRVEVKGRVWLYRDCGPIPWVRPLDKKNGEWNYLLSSVVQSLNSMVQPMKFNVADLPDCLTPNNRAFSLGRIWKLSDNAFALWDSRNLWRLHRSAADCACDHNYVPFELKQALGVATALASTVHQRLQHERSESNTELSLAARYLALSPLERQLFLIETQTGTPQEFAHLVKIALLATTAWETGPNEITAYFRAEGLRADYFRPHSRNEISIRARAIVGNLTRAFAPHLTDDKSALPPALGWQRPQLQITATKPSMHEQIEAALELRAWLQTHWPDGVKHLVKII